MKKPDRYTGYLKLAALLIAVPAVVYFGSLRNTFRLRSTFKENSLRLESMGSGARLSTTGLHADNGTDKGLADSGIRDGSVLHELGPALKRNGVTAESYTPYLLRQESDTGLYAGEMVLSGKFIPLTRLLDDMDELPCGANLVSVRYGLATNPRTRTKQLQMTLIFQQVTSNRNL